VCRPVTVLNARPTWAAPASTSPTPASQPLRPARQLSHLPALDALVRSPLPEGVMRLALEQAGRALSSDPAGRSAFVHSGGLAAVQLLAEAPGGKLKARRGGKRGRGVQ
jgi:hypothetical protein